jgi:hypothetical protein
MYIKIRESGFPYAGHSGIFYDNMSKRVQAFSHHSHVHKREPGDSLLMQLLDGHWTNSPHEIRV